MANGTKQQHAASNIVQITLNPNTTTTIINGDFLGDSIEPWRMCDLLHFDQATPATVQLFKTLGTGHIRIGGNSVEFTHWDPAGTPSCNYSNTIITKSLIDEVMNFAKKTGRKVTYPINLEHGDPITFSNEAAYAITTGGSILTGIEIGNEPDLYGWSYAQFQSNWEANYNAILAKIPTVKFIGPSVCCNQGWFGNFLGTEHAKILIGTAHPYATNGNNNPTISQLLSQGTMDSMASNMDGYVKTAKVNNLLVDLNETNAVANVPPASIGDVYGMSLWGADDAFTGADHGLASMEFHGGIPGDETSPFNGSGNIPGIRPLYYGMLLFHYALGDGGKVVPIQVSSSINLRAHAILRNDGKLAVVLINKDLTNVATAQINTTIPYTHATDIRLTAPSINAAINSISFGGSQVNSSTGTWIPTQIESVAVTGATATITVPALSGVVMLYDNSSVNPSATVQPSSPFSPSSTPAQSQNPTIPQNNTTFSITMCPHGLGNCGDNANQISGGNMSPMHIDRHASLTVLNATGQQIAAGQGNITYNQSAHNYQGSISIVNFLTGQYLIKEKLDGFLPKQVPGIISVTSGQVINLPVISVVNGDVNNDDQLDILDYNLLISCFGTKFSSASCQSKTNSDITDDGTVDGADYNLFLRELSVQKGG